MDFNDEYELPKDWDPAAAISALKQEQQVMELDHAQMAKKLLKESLPVVALSIIDLATTADNPKLRFEAGKYIIDRAFGSTGPNAGEYAEKSDGFDKILADCVADYVP